MAYRDNRQAREALLRAARPRGGYFSAAQARAAGYESAHVAYHVRVGNFERVDWGLYRLSDAPVTEHDDLIRWTLWSRDRSGEPQATVGHESALVVHGLGDVLPAVVHLIVPTGFRKRHPIEFQLHYADLGPGDAEECEGFHVTTPLRTLLDLAERPAFPVGALREAAAEALRRGLVRSKVLRARAKGAGLERRFGFGRT